MKLIKDITHLKSDMAKAKLESDQEIHEMKVKFQLEDNLKRKEIDDRVRLLQNAKEDLVNENNKINAKLTDLQQKTSSQVLEIETLKRNNDSLRKVKKLHSDLKINRPNNFILDSFKEPLRERNGTS